MSTEPPVSVPLRGGEEFKDLGFGAEVARGTRQRLLNRDGSFNVIREGLDPFASLSLYHWLLTISWPKFVAFVSGSYLVVNALFALAFLLLGPDALQSSSGSFAGHPFYREFRIANARSSQLIEVQVQVIFTKIERIRGSTVRKFYDLDLERDRVVFFALSWTVVHPSTRTVRFGV